MNNLRCLNCGYGAKSQGTNYCIDCKCIQCNNARNIPNKFCINCLNNKPVVQNQCTVCKSKP